MKDPLGGRAHGGQHGLQAAGSVWVDLAEHLGCRAGHGEHDAAQIVGVRRAPDQAGTGWWDPLWAPDEEKTVPPDEVSTGPKSGNCPGCSSRGCGDGVALLITDPVLGKYDHALAVRPAQQITRDRGCCEAMITL